MATFYANVQNIKLWRSQQLKHKTLFATMKSFTALHTCTLLYARLKRRKNMGGNEKGRESNFAGNLNPAPLRNKSSPVGFRRLLQLHSGDLSIAWPVRSVRGDLWKLGATTGEELATLYSKGSYENKLASSKLR